jgi:hypothetical protein
MIDLLRALEQESNGKETAAGGLSTRHLLQKVSRTHTMHRKW